jgi:hypothetical protein
MQQLDRLVYLTLAYSAYFKFPLTAAEIKMRLPASEDVDYLFAKKKAAFKKNIYSSKQIQNSLKKLIEQDILQTDGEYFFLDKAHLEARFGKQAYLSEKQLALAELKNVIKNIPLIKAAILTGGTAVDNAKRFDDLDVLIVCRSQTLWLVRLWLVILSKWKNKRPLKNKYAWCFNLFLDENDLKIKTERRSLYEAYEILQMKFFYDPENVEKKLIAINQDWLSKYLLYYQDRKKKPLREEKSFYLSNAVRKILNQCLFFIQKSYRQLRFGKEDFDLSLTQAFFNKGNFRFKLYSHLTKQIDKLP